MELAHNLNPSPSEEADKVDRNQRGSETRPSLPQESGREASVQSLIETAMQCHASGRLEDAQAGYDKVLAADPENADALHLSGMIACQTSQHDRAVALIEKAIGVNPLVASFHSNLGVA